MVRVFTMTLMILSLVSSTSCTNIMQGFGDEYSNEALYVSAQEYVNEGSYDLALAKIADMEGAYPTLKKVILLKASAYAGKCGLNFINLVEGISSLSTTLFLFLMTQNNGSTAASRITRAAHCATAETLIKSIGATAALRTDDENIFMALVNLTKLGNYLSGHADVNPRNGTLDTVPPDPATYDSCTDPDSQTMGWALTSALASLNASGVDLGTWLTTVNTYCAGMGGACAVQQPTAFTGPQLTAIESLIRENTIGLGTCATDINGGCGFSCP